MLKTLSKSIYYVSFPLSFMAFILPLYVNDLGGSPLEVGLLFSIFSFVSIVIRPVVGRYIDRHGRRKTLLWGLFFYSLVQALFCFGENYTVIFLARIIHSMASAFLWISSKVMIADLSTEKTYAENYGRLEQASNRGLFFGSLIGFTLLFNLRGSGVYQKIFGLFFVISLYGFFLGWKNIKETKADFDKLAGSEIAINNQFKIYLMMVLLLALVNSMLAPMFLIYLKETITANIMLISLAYIPGSILDIILPKKMGKRADQYGKKRFMLAGMILTAGLICLIPFIKTIWGFALVEFFLSFAASLIIPARSGLISQMASRNAFGKAHGLYHTALGIGGVIGPIIGSYIYQNIAKSALFYINGLITFLIALLFIFLIKEKNL